MTYIYRFNDTSGWLALEIAGAGSGKGRTQNVAGAWLASSAKSQH